MEDWCYWTNEDIFSELSYLECELIDHSPSWEGEHEYFLQEEVKTRLYLEDINKPDNYDLHLQVEMVKHNRWKKKRKHVNDTKRPFREVKRKQCWVEYVEWSYYLHVTHKHLRAEKIYHEHEIDDTDSSFWFDEDIDEGVEWWYGEYCWEDYVDRSGRALNSWELDKTPQCRFCYTTEWCDCGSY